MKGIAPGLVLALLLSACGGGGSVEIASTPGSPPSAPAGCTGECAGPESFLGVTDVERILAQAVSEAQARNTPATIAVVDRVGNVLGVFRMFGAEPTVTIRSERQVIGGLEGIGVIPSELAAIAKAVTGAFLSSEGNAFSTRTASQIIQEHFNPGEFGQPSGPLFGVQFSQLPCSDLNRRFTIGPDAGPKRSPLGLSADPGGLPLYRDGTPIGGIGVVADPVYGLDPDIGSLAPALDELIATAGAFGFFPPADRRGDRITVEGKVFRFNNATLEDLASNPAAAPGFAAVDGAEGVLTPVTGYTSGPIVQGTAFGQPESGIRPDVQFYPDRDAFVLVGPANVERFRPRDGTDGPDALRAGEVQVLMQKALDIANRARAQIRRPLGSQARVTISIVDTSGVVLALARTRDAPVFGIDVSLQKARTAAFFSGPHAAGDLAGAPNAIYLDSDGAASGVEIVMADYVTALRDFLEDPQALANGAVAFSDRAAGNLSRPYFPDGIPGREPGPLSKPFADWSPFTNGLQLDLSINRIVQHVLFVATGGGLPDTPANCTTLPRLANGSQIFPGSVPIYRGDTLVGGIGVSGDGIDQDDMIAFLGVHDASLQLGTINNAPPHMRADRLTPRGTRLRYVQCPQAPFLDSSEQNVCAGK